jgi:hypothetical protein
MLEFGVGAFFTDIIAVFYLVASDCTERRAGNVPFVLHTTAVLSVSANSVIE